MASLSVSLSHSCLPSLPRPSKPGQTGPPKRRGRSTRTFARLRTGQLRLAFDLLTPHMVSAHFGVLFLVFKALKSACKREKDIKLARMGKTSYIALLQPSPLRLRLLVIVIVIVPVLVPDPVPVRVPVPCSLFLFLFLSLSLVVVVVVVVVVVT